MADNLESIFVNQAFTEQSCFHPFRNDKFWTVQNSHSLHTSISVDGNDRKLYKSIESTVGKGEIACYEQFLLFSQSFPIVSTVDT